MNNSSSLITNVQTEQLRQATLEKLARDYAGLEARLVSQAVNEAHALASLTSVPHLVLPLLAEEKVQQAVAWAVHQRSILQADNLAVAA